MSKEIAARLRSVRIRAGYTSAAEAARAMNVSVWTYSAHEKGARGVPHRVAQDYATFFEVSPAHILFGEEEAEAPPAGRQKRDHLILHEAAQVLRSYGREEAAQDLDDLARIIAKAQERVSRTTPPPTDMVGVETKPGDRLALARKRANLSRAQLAERSGRSVSGVGALENGQNDIMPDAAQVFASILHVTPEWLLYGRGDGPEEAATAAE